MSIMPMSETIFNNKVIRSLRRGYLPFLLTLLFLLGSCQNKEDTGTLTVLIKPRTEATVIMVYPYETDFVQLGAIAVRTIPAGEQKVSIPLLPGNYLVKSDMWVNGVQILRGQEYFLRKNQ